MLKITIPNPCHEDWDKMISNQQGRHCNACMKTVVDFTTMTDGEVKNFLISKKEADLCGRFRNEQIQRIRVELPSNIFQLQMPWWKRFLVASLIVFSTTLFSCEVKHTQRTGWPHPLNGVVGMIAYEDSTKKPNTASSVTDQLPVCKPASQDTTLITVGKLVYKPTKKVPKKPDRIISGRVIIKKGK